MNWLDIIIAVPLLIGVWDGFRQGIIVQIIGIAALLTGVHAAFALGPRAGGMLGLEGLTASAVGFFAVFALTVLVMMAIGRLTRGLFKIAGLGIFDTLLGVVFSALKAALVTGVILIWLSGIDSSNNIIKESAAQQSRLYGPVVRISGTVFPYLESAGKIILNDNNTHNHQS